MDIMLSPIAGLLETVFKEIHAENHRKHEKQMQELNIINNSQLRDDYVQQILLDKFLFPIENAQHQIQNTAKHAQYMAEAINYYHQDHKLSKEDAQKISQQFRFLAIQISSVDSLYELKVVYRATTLFAQYVSKFQHRERNYSLEHGIRKGILNPLNDCIAVEKNFKRRLSLMNGDRDMSDRMVIDRVE
ncbi:MAG: hypothetical protein ACRC2R_06415 [Xenococcaceae cyanobacterium]